MNGFRVRALWIVASCIAIAGSSLAQTTLYVDGSCGNDAWSGLDPACRAPDGPKRTIQAGMNAAITGDTVIVKDGVYTGTGNKWLFFPASQNFTVRSENGPGACTIDVQSSGRAFFFVIDETPQAVVQGFTIANGSGAGGGMFFHHTSRVTVIDCTFVNNVGGAVYIENDSSPVIQNCRFLGNSTQGSGGAIAFAGASPTPSKIVNCLFAGNTAGQTGGAVYCGAFGMPPTLVNCTITNNAAATGGSGIYVGPSRSLSVVNTIVWGNAGDAIVNAGTIEVTFSDVEGGWPGAGNIASDPLLNPAAEYRLRPGSPCIDSGDDAAVPPGVTVDLFGHARFQDGNLDGPAIVDIGAHEFSPTVHSLPPPRVRKP